MLVIALLQCDLERIQCTTDYISSTVSLTFETWQSAAENRPARKVNSTLLVPAFSQCLHRKQLCDQGFLSYTYKRPNRDSAETLILLQGAIHNRSSAKTKKYWLFFFKKRKK